ncbi:prepilin-type N-terminal cleavage/methylation domain-containing protein [bacterium]|nr:prepilin-type N-terminal cleavage/methylation domain-containing protein [bacterium]
MKTTPRAQRNKGFSLIELLIAIFFLAIALLAFLVLSSYSNRGTMDAYAEIMALSLAREPIEIARTLGFKWLQKFKDKSPFKERFGTIKEKDFKYPEDAHLFNRTVKISDPPIKIKLNGKDVAAALCITVEVKMREGWARQSKDKVVLHALIWDSP